MVTNLNKEVLGCVNHIDKHGYAFIGTYGSCNRWALQFSIGYLWNMGFLWGLVISLTRSWPRFPQWWLFGFTFLPNESHRYIIRLEIILVKLILVWRQGRRQEFFRGVIPSHFSISNFWSLQWLKWKNFWVRGHSSLPIPAYAYVLDIVLPFRCCFKLCLSYDLLMITIFLAPLS